jgi:hypothetical protein
VGGTQKSSVGGQVVVGLCWRQDQVQLHEEIQQKILNEVALRAHLEKLIEGRGEALPTKNENSSVVSNQLLWGTRHKNRQRFWKVKYVDSFFSVKEHSVRFCSYTSTNLYFW